MNHVVHFIHRQYVRISMNLYHWLHYTESLSLCPSSIQNFRSNPFLSFQDLVSQQIINCWLVNYARYHLAMTMTHINTITNCLKDSTSPPPKRSPPSPRKKQGSPIFFGPKLTPVRVICQINIFCLFVHFVEQTFVLGWPCLQSWGWTLNINSLSSLTNL